MFDVRRRDFLLQAGAVGIGASVFGASTARGQVPLDKARFEASFGGEVRYPGSSAYAQLSRIMQGKDNRQPALFAHCRSTDDVRRAVLAAREVSARPAVRGGGHSYAGQGLVDGGAVIDLSGLRNIEIAADQSSITVGGGALLGALDQATGQIGKAATSGQCPTVGVAGYAMGGGVGALMGRMGLGCDNLVAADVVLADGRIVRASEEDDSELLWAIRGGGGNFGIATSLTFRLRPMEMVSAGRIRMRSENPVNMLQAYDDVVAKAPGDLTLISTLAVEDDAGPVLTIDACHCGEADQAVRDLAGLVDSPYLIENGVKRMKYSDLQASGPQEPFTISSECRGGFLTRIDQELATRLIDRLPSAPGPCFISFLPLHGAVTQVAVDQTAFPLRSHGMALSIMAFIPSPDRRREAATWATALSDDFSDPDTGSYVNVMDEQGDAAVRSAYGVNYARLAAMKARYDPDNLFRMNQNIMPSA